MRRSFLLSLSLILMANIFTVDSSQTYNKSSHLFWQLLPCTRPHHSSERWFHLHAFCVCVTVSLHLQSQEGGVHRCKLVACFFVFFLTKSYLRMFAETSLLRSDITVNKSFSKAQTYRRHTFTLYKYLQ